MVKNGKWSIEIGDIGNGALREKLESWTGFDRAPYSSGLIALPESPDNEFKGAALCAVMWAACQYPEPQSLTAIARYMLGDQYSMFSTAGRKRMHERVKKFLRAAVAGPLKERAKFDALENKLIFHEDMHRQPSRDSLRADVVTWINKGQSGLGDFE